MQKPRHSSHHQFMEDLVFLNHRRWWLACVNDTVCYSEWKFASQTSSSSLSLCRELEDDWMSHLSTSSPEWEQFTSHEDPGCWELATVQLGFRVDFGKGDKNTWIMQVVVVLHWGTHIWKWECGLASQVLGYGYHCFEGLALFSSLFLWPGVLELGWGPYIGKILGSNKYFT